MKNAIRMRRTGKFGNMALVERASDVVSDVPIVENTAATRWARETSN